MRINEFDAWMTQAKLYAGYVEPTDIPSASLYLAIIDGLMDILKENKIRSGIEDILSNHRIDKENHNLTKEMILPPNSYYVEGKTFRTHGIPISIPVDSQTIFHLKQNPFIRIWMQKNKDNINEWKLDVPEQTVYQIEKNGDKTEMNWNHLRDLQSDRSNLMEFLKKQGCSVTPVTPK
jgi:hypothetical protein